MIDFQPWIGKNYSTSSKRVLMLGESSYTEEDRYLNEASRNTIILDETNKYLNKLKTDNFRNNIGLMIDEDDSRGAWHSIAFTNLIPFFKTEPKEPLEPFETDAIKQTLWQILDEVKPTHFVVMSQRIWEKHMPDDDQRGVALKLNLKDADLFSTIWKYNYNGGSCLAIGIKHSSSFGFSHNVWRPFVQSFFKIEIGKT